MSAPTACHCGETRGPFRLIDGQWECLAHRGRHLVALPDNPTEIEDLLARSPAMAKNAGAVLDVVERKVRPVGGPR